MGIRKTAPHTCSCTIRLTVQERRKVVEYCKEHDLTASEYFRFLARTHLKVDKDMKTVESAIPQKIPR